jgi:hypothetical protein
MKNSINKPRLVKDYDKLDEAILEQIKLNYPRGFDKHIIRFKNAQGKFVSALPFEGEEIYYLVRMTEAQARGIIEDDDDYNELGHLKKSVREEYEEKYDMSDEDEDDVDDHVDIEDLEIPDESINFDDED